MKERRGFILDVNLHDHCTKAYFDNLHHEWNNGGAEAFLAFCQQRQVPGDRLGELPQTEALVAQQRMSLDPVHQWWLEKLTQGQMGLDDAWPTFVSHDWLYTDYVSVTNDMGVRRARVSESQLSYDMADLLPASAKRKKRVTASNVAKWGAPNIVNRQLWGWDLPPLKACRDFFDAKMGLKYPWPPIDAQVQSLPSGSEGGEPNDTF